ncbi:MAG: hypothetical protein ACD_63C00104G0004 [uncultured bacterium]|nr:MAG: hypothetical protein ACD_63C00104G0004 [uncultured bacterium]
MKLLSIIKSIVFALIMASFLEFLLYYPDYLIWILVGMIALAALFSMLSLWKNFWESKTASMMPAIFAVSSFGFVFFLKEGAFRHIFIGGVFAAFFVMFWFFTKEKKSREINIFFTVVTAFLFFYTLGNFSDFFNIVLWQVLIALYIVVSALMFQLLSSKFRGQIRKLLYVLVLGLCVIEMYWALTFWPSTLLVKTIVLLVVFYSMAGVTYDRFAEKLDRGRILSYIILSGIVIAVVLGTAQWISK